ncbi:hypothetical protein [Hansschlegelia zhihuaiae]|uniref:Phage tail assembly chaperone n=1 Tax=Hansschlegelia zhihuaiae TaxID=405005 RepID=A0A4V1KI27_9HYPH|nr:hypothetical protein [Hansschlegelia zhihuaiae]RXF69232.1 hypothetical protein EK403_18780 [Hansschlegelia zhihuaiae]
MLAAEEITIRIDGERIVLRPTLRVALRLERRHEGLAALVDKIQDGDLAAIADVLREHSPAWSDVPSFIESLGVPHGLFAGVRHLIPALIAHVYSLAGVDLEDETDTPSTGSRLASRETFAEHLEGLFKVATGWLGWSPETAWSSTPAEIRAAQAGFIDLQNALRGVAPKKPDHRTLDDKFADVFLGLSTRAQAA